MERSSSSSRASGSKKGGKKEKGKKRQQPQQQQQQMLPPHAQQPMPPPYMARPPPPQMPYHPGPFPFPGAMRPPGTPTDPNQQRLLQIQLRQQQIQLQQMQQRQQAVQQQQAQQQQQQRGSPPSQSAQQQQKQQQQQQHFSSYTTTTTPHAAKQQTNTTPHTTKPTTTTTKPTAPPTTLPKASAPSPTTTSTSRTPAPPPPSQEQVKLWLSQCDWKDKTIYTARQMLGGTSLNGFMRATAAAQRIKKTRGRQVEKAKRKSASEAAPTLPGEHPVQPPPSTPEQTKLDIFNPRTAKKIKLEMQQGAVFVKNLYENVQSIMRELDPTGRNVPPPIHRLSTNFPKATTSSKAKTTSTSKAAASYASATSASTTKSKGKAATQSTTKTTKTTTAAVAAPPPAPGVQGSTLRKHRKRKLVNYILNAGLSEHDASGKRLYTKKEHNARIGEVLRFRGLSAGDYVAARLSSRDLWILARVVHDYPGVSMNPNEFLKLTDAKRDALFRNKVIVKDAEEKASAKPIAVSRQLILPLPRTYAEAAEWGSRLKKGLLIYAMYPHTTSLYAATVVDNTTYCRGDDDIIVVEFDEDERDATGALPKCHIPARFCVMIPRECQPKKKTTEAKQSTTKAKKAPAPAATRNDQTDPALNSMLKEMDDDALGDFGPLVDFSAGS